MARKRLRGPIPHSLLTAMNWGVLFVLGLTIGCNNVAPTVEPEDPFAGASAVLSENGLTPSNQREWSPDLAVLPYAEFNGDLVTVHNIRNCIYVSNDDYVVNHYDRAFDLRDIESVDFVVVPFKDTPNLAHTMLSFGFSDGDYVGLSVEARLERGESYSPLMGGLGQYELMYVIADERDVVLRRAKYRGDDVYLYRTVATPEQSRELFEDVLRRANHLYRQPEFYDTLTNNCATNIARHVNRIRPGRISYDVRILLPGMSDQLAYEMGFLRRQGTFARTRRRANISERANRYADSSDFSRRIRR